MLCDATMPAAHQSARKCAQVRSGSTRDYAILPVKKCLFILSHIAPTGIMCIDEKYRCGARREIFNHR